MMTNNSLYSDSAYQRGKEFGLLLTFHKAIDGGLFTYLSNSRAMPKKEETDDGSGKKDMDEGQPTVGNK